MGGNDKRCEYAASDSALDSLDLLRGMWNLRYNHSKTLPLYATPRPAPLNSIVLGPFHSLHNKNGTLATNVFWWDSSYRNPIQLLPIEKDYEALKQHERLLRKLIAKSRFCPYLNQGLVRYARALDESDLSSAFIKLWSVLEYLTGTRKTENYGADSRATFEV